MDDPDGQWTGGWDPHALDRRAALAALTADQRMEWLEGMLTLFDQSGALARERAGRQRAADRWDTGPS